MNNTKLNWFDRMMVTMTFAEAGELDTALQYLEPERPARKVRDDVRKRKQAQQDNRPRMNL